MGRFFTKNDIPVQKYDRDYSYKEMDWFVGDQTRFTYKFRWYIEDYGFEKTTSPIPRIEVRKWCDTACVGDMLVLDGKYFTKIGEAKWNSSGNVPTYYVDLMFDTEEDAVLFKLMWWDRAANALEDLNGEDKS